MARRENGTVWAWGANSYGQLGDGTKQRRNRPVQVMGLRAAAITAGGFHNVGYGWPLNVAGISRPPAVKADYSDKTVKELREELRTRDLKVSGQNQELVDRLEQDDLDAIAQAAEAEAAAAETKEAEATEAEAEQDPSAEADTLRAVSRTVGRRHTRVSGPRTDWCRSSASTSTRVIRSWTGSSGACGPPVTFEAYSWILSKITESQRYPSLRLLDRLTDEDLNLDLGPLGRLR